MDYKSIYEKILNIDAKTRYVTICDMDGRIAQTGHRKGVKHILSRGESIDAITMATNSWKLRNKVSGKIGKGKYAIAEYEKIKRITIPFGGEHLIYLTTEADADHSKIIDNIIKYLSEF